MNRKNLISLFRVVLKATFSKDELLQIQSKRNRGELLDVFERAVEDAINSHKADEFQEETLK
jgi:hypothetical protein